MKKVTYFIAVLIVAFSFSFHLIPAYIIKKECLSAETKENFARMSAYLTERNKTALISMVTNHEVYIVKKNSKVELLEQDDVKSKVKIKSGPLKGKIVYVNSSFILQVYNKSF